MIAASLIFAVDFGGTLIAAGLINGYANLRKMRFANPGLAISHGDL
jgi:hypothetical protein